MDVEKIHKFSLHPHSRPPMDYELLATSPLSKYFLK